MSDLVTFGESMLRLSPPGDDRLERADSLTVHIAGAESNVAIAAQRLGVDAAWISKLPDSPVARRVVRPIEGHGVDADVVWSGEGRQGLYYLETGGEPRGLNVVYDRAGSAVTTVQPGDLDTETVESAEVFHTSGITPALSDATAETTAQLLSIAAQSGTTVSFDLNYRSKLWSHAEARDTLEPLLADVDLLFAPRRDTESILGIDAAAQEMARHLAGTYGIETVVVTMGGDGALALHGGECYEQSVYPASDRRPIGTGDAFVGGFLAALVETDDLDTALSWGAAAAALKRSIPGDIATITPDEVREVIDGATPDISR